jgi:outer membrane protein TolC
MVSINLPWLNPQHREQVRAQEYEVAAEKRAVESSRITIRYQIRDAYARYEAALQSFRIIDQALLPQARQSFEAAQSTYSVGGGDALGLLDALRSLLQVRLDHVRALVDLGMTTSELERAASADIERQPLMKGKQP